MRDDPELRGKSAEILHAFARNVARYGYDGTSFSIIAAELGISRGLIAHHFGTKQRLLATLHASYMRRKVDDAIRIVAEFATPAEQLAGLLYAFILYQKYDRDTTVAFQREFARFARESEASEGRKLGAEYTGILRDLIDAGVASGEFRVVDTKVRILLMLGAADWAWTWFRPEGQRTAERVGAELVDEVLGSLLVTRRRLARLTNPDGAIVATVSDILASNHPTPAKLSSA